MRTRINKFLLSLVLASSPLAQAKSRCELALSAAQNVVDVAIVGAGIAGLTAAYELRKNGIGNVTILEADARPGGRIRSQFAVSGEARIGFNAGAELVDSNNENLLSLARELGVETVDRKKDQLEESFVFIDPRGKVWRAPDLEVELNNIQKPFLERLEKYQKLKQGLIPADEIAAVERELYKPDGDYIQQQLDLFLKDLGAGDLVLEYMAATLGTELGLSLAELSLDHLLWNYRVNRHENGNLALQFLPNNDEAYRIKGGTQQLIDQLIKHVGAQVKLSSPVEGIVANDAVPWNKPGEPWTVTYRGADGKAVQLRARHVIVTTPIPNLENLGIRFQEPYPSQHVFHFANDFTYASNTKLSVVFRERYWNRFLDQPVGFSAKGFQFWEASHEDMGINPRQGILTGYFGGALSTPEQQERAFQDFISELERLYPGISNQVESRHFFPWQHSYSGAFKPWEQMSRVNLPRLIYARGTGNLYLAGEAFGTAQGYMDGAVESAREAVARILEARQR